MNEENVAPEEPFIHAAASESQLQPIGLPDSPSTAPGRGRASFSLFLCEHLGLWVRVRVRVTFKRRLYSLIDEKKKYRTLHEFACHPCAGAMLIFSVSFQF